MILFSKNTIDKDNQNLGKLGSQMIKKLSYLFVQKF